MRPVADQRILRGVGATLSYQFVDSDGEPAAPSGAVTIGVTKADGSVLVAAGTATGGSGTAPRTYSLPAVNTLELLTATWTDAGVGSTATSLIDVVGGVYFTVAEVRRDPSLQDATKYPDAYVILARREAEEQCESITGAAWVPRYRRVRLNGYGGSSLVVPDVMIQVVRSVRFYSDGTTYTALSASELAALAIGEAVNARVGIITRVDLGTFLTVGYQAAVVEYEHGQHRPPEAIKSAAMIHTRHILNMWKRSGLIDRATMVTEPDGGTMLLATPGKFGFETGIPDVDAVYLRPGLNFRSAQGIG